MTRLRAALLGSVLLVAVACAPAAPTRPPAPSDPIEAARAFLTLTSARFELRQERFKPDLPVEHILAASGVVDPAADRGALQWEMLPWFPEQEEELRRTIIDVVWTADEYWGSSPPLDGEARRWTHARREEVVDLAIIGRIQEEPLALIRLAAAADVSMVEAMSDASIDGANVRRWRIDVPVADARAAFVPYDTYSSFADVFGVDALPVEIWLHDGQLVRAGYVFERELAPYGGPDRIETYYDWSGFGDEAVIEIPPAGIVVEMDR